MDKKLVKLILIIPSKDEQGNRAYQRLDTKKILSNNSVEKLRITPLIFEDNCGKLKPTMNMYIDSQSRVNTLLVMPYLQDEMSPTNTYIGAYCYVKGLSENQ